MTAPMSPTVRLSPAERAAYGRNARKRAPRSCHGRFEPAQDRPDPVAVLEEQGSTRLPELVPVRYGRMLASPFSFYRGAAAVMAADLAPLPGTGLTVQLCGDAHLLNFGLLASPERHLVFDINDFDETLSGPFEWDVKRLAASLVVAARANGFSARDQDRTVRECVRTYRTRMRIFAGMRTLDVWYAQDDADRMRELLAASMTGRARRRTAEATARARTRTHLEAFARLTRVTAEGRRIAPEPPLVTPLRDLPTGPGPGGGPEERLRTVLEGYADSLSSERRYLLGRYRLVDMARKVVGVGSVGTRCWILLLLGKDDGDPLLLQAKEAQESVLAAYTGDHHHDNQGRRVVEGQRLIQAASDIFLGWTRVAGLDGRDRDFYVRQLRDWKGTARPETMDPGLLRLYGHLCGASLARAHARSGDPVVLAAYLGGSDRFDRALTGFAQAYADQNERDHKALRAAVRKGGIRAATG
ncbi:DUF2252 domain-containing protein [Streptomyces sp. NPDC127190]|uniref:DUF2252 domain-containing protein n=1 Tax=unclassified Streptomyces TaxID=2593676 RepID=UPI0036370E7D